ADAPWSTASVRVARQIAASTARGLSPKNLTSPWVNGLGRTTLLRPRPIVNASVDAVLALFPHVGQPQARGRAEAAARSARGREDEHDDRHQVRERVRPQLRRAEVDLAGLELGCKRLQRAEEVRADEA